MRSSKACMGLSAHVSAFFSQQALQDSLFQGRRRETHREGPPSTLNSKHQAGLLPLGMSQLAVARRSHLRCLCTVTATSTRATAKRFPEAGPLHLNKLSSNKHLLVSLHLHVLPISLFPSTFSLSPICLTPFYSAFLPLSTYFTARRQPSSTQPFPLFKHGAKVLQTVNGVTIRCKSDARVLSKEKGPREGADLVWTMEQGVPSHSW